MSLGVEDKPQETRLTVGLGVHKVQWEGKELFCSLQRVGHPVGTYDCAEILEEFVVFAAGPKLQDTLHSFLEWVYVQSQCKDDEDTYRVYTWKVEEKWWKTAAIRRKRPMESVVLPADTKEKILADITDFKSEETGEWYAAHGIPYKRSYLLYGPPRNGKDVLFGCRGVQV